VCAVLASQSAAERPVTRCQGFTRQAVTHRVRGDLSASVTRPIVLSGMPVDLGVVGNNIAPIIFPERASS
jgi:hypothetical protein